MKATKKQLREEISALRFIGAQMSNLCFNLSQKDHIYKDHKDIMHELRVKWDAIKRAERE